MPGTGTYKPIDAVVEITNRCNMRCIHCASNSGVAREGELSLPEMTRLIDDLKALGCRQVTLLGGEVFLRRDWGEIGRHAKGSGLSLILITNGLLLDERRLKELIDLQPSVVGVSLDGATPESYARVRGADGFGKALEALGALSRAGACGTNAITTFHRANLREFDDFIPLFEGTPITWQIQIAGKGGERFHEDLFLTPEDYGFLADKVLQLLTEGRHERVVLMDDFGYFPLEPGFGSFSSWKGCQAGQAVIGVRSNGDVLPCLSLGDRFVVSNVRREPLKDIWENEEYFGKFRRRREHLEGACGACDVRERCGGGCADMAFSTTGSLFENRHCLRLMERRRIVDLIAPPEG